MPTNLLAAASGRRVGGLTVSLLFAFTVTLFPVLHSEVESLMGTAGVEREHTADCTRIHNDLSCPAGGALRALAGKPVRTVGSPTQVLAAARPPAPPPIPRPVRAGPTLDRGPPIA